MHTRRRLCIGAAAGLVSGGAIACAGQRRAAEPVLEERTLDDASAVAARLWPKTNDARLGAQTPAERAAIFEVVQAIATAQVGGGEPPAALRARASDAALSLQVWRVASTTLWVLCEPEDQRRGAGAYLFRTGESRGRRYLVLQSPHSLHDAGTGQLALGSFLDGPPQERPQALFVNTIHRYAAAGGTVPPAESPSDVCHVTDHPFNTALGALAQARPKLHVAQLHGFADREVDRIGAQGREPLLAVVSPGAHPRSQAWVSRICDSLHREWGDGARRFPDQVRLLGAKTNVQSRLLAAYPESRFAHIELSASVRARPSAEVVATLTRALAEPPREEGSA